MSRIGKKPIPVPAGVKVDVKGSHVAVQGPKVGLKLDVHPAVKVAVDGATINVSRVDEQRESRALHGLFRSLIANMIVGVTQGFEKKLEIIGVGYGAKIEGKLITLTVGYSKPVKLPIPEGVTIKLPDATHIQVQGPDKQVVGQFAAEIRAVRKPEPYKGTGVRYEGEQVRRKSGKAFGSG
jgi:large subunit ribosomal protein L6